MLDKSCYFESIITTPFLSDGNCPLLSNKSVELLDPGTWSNMDKLDIVACSADTMNRIDKDGASALFMSSAAGDSNVTKMLISHPQMDVNRATINGSSPLHIASEKRHEKVVKLLLSSSKINVNTGNSEGYTPLHIASLRGYENIVFLLLDHPKIDPNQVDNNDTTALMEASNNGKSRVVEILLSHSKIDVNMATWKGTTALFLASEEGHAEIVQLLLRCPQTDTNHLNENDNTALEVAPEMSDYFNSRPSLIRRGHTCCSIQMRKGLIIAVEDGNEKMTQNLLKCEGMDVNEGYASGVTPLYKASMEKHADVTKLLLKVPHIDVNQIVNGETALLIAAAKGFKEIVKLLLSHSKIDTNINKRGNQGSALYIASKTGYPEIVEHLLLQPQIEVNMVYGPLSRTALFVAAVMGHTDIVKLILQCPKADLNITDIFGNTPHESGTIDAIQAIAMRDKFLEMGETCCLDVNQVILNRAITGDHKAIRGLAQCPKANINIQDSRDKTSLYLASQMGHVQAVKVLLSQTEIDSNKNNGVDGKVAFSIASEMGHFDIMEQLIIHPTFNVNKAWLNDAWALMHGNLIPIYIANVTSVPKNSSLQKG